MIVSVWSGSSAIGGLAAGLLADRISAKRIMAAQYALAAIAFWFLLGVDSFWMAVLWAVLFGTVQGGTMSMQQVLLADYYGRASLGAIRGMVLPVMNLTNAAGAWGAAALYDLYGDYYVAFATFGVLNMVAAICAALARSPKAPPALERQRGSSEGAP